MITKSRFKPAWWLRNKHMQTLWPYFFRKRPEVVTRRERLELPDGDFLDLSFTTSNTGPLVLVLHGLEGSIRSKYAAGIMHALDKNGYRGILMHFRGCSGQSNRKPYSYHSGETKDPLYVIKYLQQRFPNTSIAAVGFSLGGNALLKLLGEHGQQQSSLPLATAVAVSVPFRLDISASALNIGIAKVYRQYLLRSMIRSVMNKSKKMSLDNIDLDKVANCRDLWEFDNEATAKLHGFADVHDYYQRCSSRSFLKHIQTPTLILHASNDPFMTPAAIPQEHELSTQVNLELSQHGGHVGFVNGQLPWQTHYWLEQRIIEHLSHYLK